MRDTLNAIKTIPPFCIALTIEVLLRLLDVTTRTRSGIVGFRLRERKRKTRCKCAVIKPGLCFTLALLRGLVKAHRDPHVRHEERGFR